MTVRMCSANEPREVSRGVPFSHYSPWRNVFYDGVLFCISVIPARTHTDTPKKKKKAEKKKKQKKKKKNKKKKVQRENLSRSSDRYDNKLLKTSDVQSTHRLLSFPEVLHYCGGGGGFSKLRVRTHKWLTGSPPPLHPPPSCLPSMPHLSHRIDLMSWGSRGEWKIFQIWYPRCEKLPIPLSTGEQPVATLSCQSVVTITPGEEGGGGGRREEEEEEEGDRKSVV